MKLNSLRTKYILGVSGLILFVFLALLTYTRLQFFHQLENELHKRGNTIARNLATSAVSPILTENHIALQLLVNEIKRNEVDVRYIYVVNKSGTLLAHTFGQSFPPDLIKTDRSFVEDGMPIRQLQTDDESIEDLTATIHDGDFGRVHVGISEDFIKQELHRTLLHGLPIVIMILVVGIAGAYWFAIGVTDPLAHLSEQVKKVGSGEFGNEISNIQNDELGDLARAYNTMIRQLRELTDEQLRTEQELRQQASLLENEVTVRRQAQEELALKQQQLEVLNHALEERVSSAISELRLKDKIMLLQGRQAAMGEMINNIAHQWRQPINNLGLIVQCIESEYKGGTLTSEEMGSSVERAMSTILFMSQTINDFSSFFSPDRMRTTFRLFSGIKKVIAMMEATLSSSGITVQIDQQDDVLLEGFFNEYNQVLLNLMNNAKDILVERKTTEPTITVIISRVNDMAVLKVRDNAGGIADDVIERVFDPYFTTKEQGKGSGVGLYMSRMIIQDHFSGSITAANVDGGAEFTISTPSLPIDTPA